MPKLNLTKTLAENAQPKAKYYDIRDTVTPSYLLKMTPSGRKMFMLAYTTAHGQRRKPARQHSRLQLLACKGTTH